MFKKAATSVAATVRLKNLVAARRADEARADDGPAEEPKEARRPSSFCLHDLDNAEDREEVASFKLSAALRISMHRSKDRKKNPMGKIHGRHEDANIDFSTGLLGAAMKHAKKGRRLQQKADTPESESRELNVDDFAGMSAYDPVPINMSTKAAVSNIDAAFKGVCVQAR